jgi:preprotein translocase subunit YajC
MFLPLAVLVVVMILMTSMGGRKQRKQRNAMLAGLKRGDRVLTSGGVIGTVVDLSDQEMTLRVDESSNTRIRFARSFVQNIMREGREAGRPEVEVKPESGVPAAN